MNTCTTEGKPLSIPEYSKKTQLLSAVNNPVSKTIKSSIDKKIGLSKRHRSVIQNGEFKNTG